MPSVKYTTAKGLYQETGSQVYLPTSYTYVTATGNQDLSSIDYGNHIVMVNVALADTNYIRLPEATTSNGGQVITVIMGLSPADNAYVGFVTTTMTGGGTTISDGSAGLLTANNAYVATTSAKSLILDAADGNAATSGIGAPGTIITFYYTGVANSVYVRVNGIGSINSATLAALFSGTAVNAH
jgi:hypothetical protein